MLRLIAWSFFIFRAQFSFSFTFEMEHYSITIVRWNFKVESNWIWCISMLINSINHNSTECWNVWIIVLLLLWMTFILSIGIKYKIESNPIQSATFLHSSLQSIEIPLNAAILESLNWNFIIPSRILLIAYRNDCRFQAHFPVRFRSSLSVRLFVFILVDWANE
jgi:hypothetical protein